VFDSTALGAAIPKELAPQAFLDEERNFAWRMFSTGGYPTSIYATSLSQTWFRRLMVQGIADWLAQEPNALVNLLEHIDDYMHANTARCDGVGLARYSHEMVTQNPPSVHMATPPDLAADAPTSDAFEGWLANVDLVWTDTHEPLSTTEAIIARLVCRYLAANAH
jgi:hypothetical protein